MRYGAVRKVFPFPAGARCVRCTFAIRGGVCVGGAQPGRHPGHYSSRPRVFQYMKTVSKVYTTGMLNKLESIRSSQPPCPGNVVPLSFMPAPRLKADSHKSPNCPAIFAAPATTSTSHGAAEGIR